MKIKKDKKMAKFGKAGHNALLEKLGPVKYKAHMRKNARKRWEKHPEQRSEAFKAKARGKKK